MRAPSLTTVAGHSGLRTMCPSSSTATREASILSHSSSRSIFKPAGMVRAAPFTTTSIVFVSAVSIRQFDTPFRRSLYLNVQATHSHARPFMPGERTIENMPTSYPEIYFPIVVQIVIAFAVAAGLIAASTLLGKRARSPLKDTPYESGMAPVGSARERFSVKFYLVGMIFILFDIEAVFLYPWVVVYRDLKMFGFVEMLIFVAVVLMGFFYVWKKGALDWAVLKKEGSK